MQRFSRRHGINVRGFTDEARHILLKHSWPGNVRELQNVIERAVILCGENGMLEARHLGLAGAGQENKTDPALVNSNGAAAADTQPSGFPTLADIEKRHILAALNHCQGNRTHAAKLLDVSIRTLRNKLHEYNRIARSAQDDIAAA
jgi:DNA-binding NtrC family response regulator